MKNTSSPKTPKVQLSLKEAIAAMAAELQEEYPGMDVYAHLRSVRIV